MPERRTAVRLADVATAAGVSIATVQRWAVDDGSVKDSAGGQIATLLQAAGYIEDSMAESLQTILGFGLPIASIIDPS